MSKLLKVFTTKFYKITGAAGKIIFLRPGFVNFLIKKGIVEFYTDQKEIISNNEEIVKEGHSFSPEDLTINFYRSANKSGGLYEKIDKKDIINSLALKSIKVNPFMLFLESSIKKLGNYKVNLQIEGEIYQLNLNVLPERGSDE